MAWVASWDCEGQVLSWRQSGWWNGSRPRVGCSYWWRWGHTTLEYHSGTKGIWTLGGICCDGDLMVGRSCSEEIAATKCLAVIPNHNHSRVRYIKLFLTLTSHCSISAMMTVDCSHSTHTTLCNVWLSISTTEVAKNWTTAFTKVGTSQKCGSCSQQQTKPQMQHRI